MCVQPAAIPVGLIKTCIHTYAALAVGVVVYNMDKAGACASLSFSFSLSLCVCVCVCVCVCACVRAWPSVPVSICLSVAERSVCVRSVA